MNILITGGAGFIGSHLALKLLAKGYEVTILDNLSYQIHGDTENSFLYQSVKGKCDFIKGDVTNKLDWLKAIKNNEVIAHLAAETGTGQSMYEITNYVKTNSIGTANLLDILVNEKHAVKKVIVASSRAIYGEGKYYCTEHGTVYPKVRKKRLMKKGDFECKCPLCDINMVPIATDEESKIHPSSVYGITKSNQEQMVLKVCKSINIPAMALRYQNVYGPGQSLSNPYTGILSIFSNLILNDKQINAFEDGKESRDFVFIDDVVRATINGIEYKEAINETFNVGTGTPVSVLDVARQLFKSYKRGENIHISGDFRIGDIRHNFADLTKIKTLLGYSPKVSFEQGIKIFSNWVSSQNIHEIKYNNSLEEMRKRKLFYGE